MFGSLNEAHPTASFEGRPRDFSGTACPGSGPVWGLRRPWGVKALPLVPATDGCGRRRRCFLAHRPRLWGCPSREKIAAWLHLESPCLCSTCWVRWPWQPGRGRAWERAGCCTCFGHCPQRLLTGWFWWELFCLFDVFLGDSETTGLNIGYWRLYGKVLNSAEVFL